MKLDTIKLFILALILNVIENIGLLFFLEIDITKQIIFSSSIFALVLALAYEVLKNKGGQNGTKV